MNELAKSSVQNVTFDESVPFSSLFPYRSAPPPPPPLFLAPGPPPVAVGSDAAGGAASGVAEPGVAGSEGAGSGGTEPGGEEPRGVEPEGVEPGGVESEGVETGGAEPDGAALSGGPAGASLKLSPQQLCEWLVWRARLRGGAAGAGGAGAAEAGGAGVTAGAGSTGGTAATGLGGARTKGTGATGTGGVGDCQTSLRTGRRTLSVLQLLYLVLLPCCLPLRETQMHQTSRPRALTQRRLRGVDYFQSFSPTLKMTTLRVLLHVAAQRDSLDFSTAFLQGSLHEEIWLRCPPGFTGSFPAGTQWSLRRPVYGPRQVPREWHDTLRTTLAALGFALASADLSLFLRTDTSLPTLYVLVYVDDLVFATPDTEALTLVKSELRKRHTCTDLGELRNYHGLQITRERARRTITLTQSHMVHQVLQRFGFQFSSPQPTPLFTGHSL
ncbi:unnamed protein product [Closterium sp. NIES-54]